MIRIDEIWLATEPLDMSAGPDKALARMVQVFGAARPHCAYLFANRRGNRMKALIHDGFGIWLCARRLHRGKFHWGGAWRGDQLRLTEEQLVALKATIYDFAHSRAGEQRPRLPQRLAGQAGL